MSKVPIPRSRQFRILALPLARIPRQPSHSSANPPQSLPEPSTASSSSSSSSSKSSDASTTAKTPLILFQVSQPDASPENGPPSLPTRMLTRASDAWLKLGNRPKDSWMYWFYRRGEGLMDRIEYEEWALKGVHEGRGVKVVKQGEDKQQEMIEIPLLKPSLREQPLPNLLPKLHRFLIHRVPYHRKMMYRSLTLAPVTFPFAIIPVVPNFPLFYVLWRAWSHYRAWRGATYLESLLKLGMIIEKESPQLTEVYDSKGVVMGAEGSENVAPDSTSSDGVKQNQVSEKGSVNTAAETSTEPLPGQAKGKGPAPDGTATPESMVYDTSTVSEQTKSKSNAPPPRPRHPALLLSLNQVPILAKMFDLKGQEVMDVNRAVEQADTRAKKADEEKAQSEKEKEDPPKGDQKPPTNWRGNLHR